MTDSSVVLGRRKQARGKVVVWARHYLSGPIGRRISVSLVRRIHRLRRRAVPAWYTDADPFALLEVDPNRIERSVLESAPKRPQWGRVQGGSWDRRWEPFDDRAVPRGLVQRYEEGRPWSETALFDAYLEQLRRFGNAWGYTEIEDFERRCAEIDHLYESIRTNGYRRQAALEGVPGRQSIASLTDEINVDLARDGTFCWRGYGQHRLAIAKLLDLDTVPVLIHRRHRRWQRVRSQIRTAAITGDDRSQDSAEIDRSDADGGSSRDDATLDSLPTDHPDVQDLFEEKSL